MPPTPPGRWQWPTFLFTSQSSSTAKAADAPTPTSSPLDCGLMGHTNVMIFRGGWMEWNAAPTPRQPIHLPNDRYRCNYRVKTAQLPLASFLRVGLGLVFLASGTQKILQPHEFLSAVAGYEILSPSLTSLLRQSSSHQSNLALGILSGVRACLSPAHCCLAASCLSLFPWPCRMP